MAIRDMAIHECTQADLEWADLKDMEDNGESLSWPVKCRVCGKKYEKLYFPDNSFWDPEAEEHVYLPS